MSTPFPITFATDPIGLNPMSQFDAAFAAATNGQYMQDGTLPDAALVDSGVTPGTYGDGAHLVQVVVSAKGLLTSVSQIALTVAVSQITGLGAGVSTFLATPTSANLAAAVTDKTGSGPLVFANSPALAGTPTAPTAASGTNNTQIATTAFVLANGGGTTYVNVKDAYGVIGGNDSGDRAKIQTALDADPIGDILFFPADDYALDQSLVMSKHKSLKLDPKATLNGNFTGHSSYDNLQIAITSSPVSDIRNMIIEGGTWINTGGNCAININPTNSLTNQNPHFETIIRNANISGGLKGIRIGGADAAGDTNFCTIDGCNITVSATSGADSCVHLDGCADGHRIINNLLFGNCAGVHVNVVSGAFNTLIQGNGIVNRDGAILITNGSRVIIRDNQIEQQGGANTLVPSSSILVQGLSYICAGVIIEGNNFGGGSNVGYSIVLYNARGAYIDHNQFNVPNVNDIYFGDGGGGLTAKYNTIGPNNWMRGTRSLVTGARTDISRRMTIKEDSACVANRGYWLPSSTLTFANSWVAGDDGLEYMQTADGQLRFEGSVKGGTVTLGTTIFTLPEGYRPRVLSYPVIFCDDGSQHYVQLNAAGAVTTGTGIPASPNNVIRMSAVACAANYLSSYDAGP